MLAAIAGRLSVEVLLRPQRMQAPHLEPVSQETLSGIANNDPFNVAYTDSSSAGHSIAAQAARSVSTSSR